jgi:hypothetical protein
MPVPASALFRPRVPKRAGETLVRRCRAGKGAKEGCLEKSANRKEGCLEKFQQQLCFAVQGGQPGERKPLSNRYQLPKPQGFSASPKGPKGG